MVDKVIFIRSDEYYPYRNQAIEAVLTEVVPQGAFIVYLWSNDKTVFVGKNQNAYLECKVTELERDGGYVARRLSGGGAVYHDKGNLNFTFIARKDDYDVDRQFAIMTQAMRSLGFDACRNGRNDVVIDGRKFSGNAFYSNSHMGMHHGTVLICSDKDTIAKYLNVSAVKLTAKGVKSVVSRIVNLCELKQVDKSEVADALERATIDMFPNADTERWTVERLPKDRMAFWHDFFADSKHRLGDNVYYDARIERRFSWGTADVRLKLNRDVITKAKIYSDTLDTRAVERKEKLLEGVDITVNTDSEIADIVQALREQADNN